MKRLKREVSEFLSRDGSTLVAPSGMSDLIPPDAAERRALSRRILRWFELAGYDLATPPVFEHAEVIVRGNELYDNRELLRFVEPESGEVAVLRPDITPQIARIIATRLRDRPAPFRLCYEGRVFRRQRGRARSHAQITQVGVECVGMPGPEGDSEMLALLIEALESVGLEGFRVELSDANLVRALIERVPEDRRSAATQALARKDEAALRALDLPHRTLQPLATLLRCYGGHAVLSTARAQLRGRTVCQALDNLEETTKRLDRLGLSERILFDLGETRGFEYYTGLRFTVLVEGPGEALGQGGRYDDLLSRFDMDAPATGFALALGYLQAALRRQRGRAQAERGPRLLLAGKGSSGGAEVAARLRAADIVVAALPGRNIADALAFAKAWEYDGVLIETRAGLQLIRAADRARHPLAKAGPREIRKLIKG